MSKAPDKIQKQLARTKKKSTTTKKKTTEEENKPLPSVVDLADLSEDEIMEIVPRLKNKELEDVKPRSINFCGDLNEEAAMQIMSSLIYLDRNNEKVLVDEETNTHYVSVQPIEFYISTFGGNAADMFGIHDLMMCIRKDTPIQTVGLSKVMSAGVLLLASGTEGERYVGRNTRLMIHSLRAGYSGPMHELETEYEETKWLQTQYVEALAAATNMSKAYIRKLMGRKSNVYVNAEEAIELGIADRILPRDGD
jgi:ATP-dependent Clp endopeptidase proteolytic subunit ClpP